NPIGIGVVYNSAVHLTGPYKVDNLAVSGRLVSTNKVPSAPYRGAGRPEATFAMERTIDLVAGALALEAVGGRRRDNVPAAATPYPVRLPHPDAGPLH